MGKVSLKVHPYPSLTLLAAYPSPPLFHHRYAHHLVQPADWILSDCYPNMPIVNATAHLGVISTMGS